MAQEGKKKVEKAGGGGDAMDGTGKSVVLAHIAAKRKAGDYEQGELL